MAEIDTAFARLVKLAEALQLPGIEKGTSYGTPALKVGGKSFVRIKDAGTLVLHCPVDAKDMLLEIAPEIYYQTDHYIGWPAVLVRLGAIDDEELALRLRDAFMHKAPARLRKTLTAQDKEKS